MQAFKYLGMEEEAFYAPFHSIRQASRPKSQMHHHLRRATLLTEKIELQFYGFCEAARLWVSGFYEEERRLRKSRRLISTPHRRPWREWGQGHIFPIHTPQSYGVSGGQESAAEWE
jgi:hypothetical protein